MSRTSGMGDFDSTDIAQEVHMAALRKVGGLHEPGVLRWLHLSPLSDIVQGVYIDDGLVVGIVPKTLKHAPVADFRLCVCKPVRLFRTQIL